MDASPPQLTSTEPFSFAGGPTGILLIHGFMGTPGELRPLGAFLAERGYTVASVLVARHDQPPEAMRGVRWHEWFASIEPRFHELRAQCEQVIVVGYSMGGLLALHLAAHEHVDGLITLAPALQLAGGWPLRTLGVAQFAMPWFYPFRAANFRDPRVRASVQQRAGAIDLDDPAVVAQIKASVRISTGAIYQLIRLGARVRSELPQIQTPTLVLQGRRDETVLPISAEQVYNGLGSHDKQLVWFERSGHLLPNDVEQQQVQHTIAQWLAARLPQPKAARL